MNNIYVNFSISRGYRLPTIVFLILSFFIIWMLVNVYKNNFQHKPIRKAAIKAPAIGMLTYSIIYLVEWFLCYIVFKSSIEIYALTLLLSLALLFYASVIVIKSLRDFKLITKFLIFLSAYAIIHLLNNVCYIYVYMVPLIDTKFVLRSIFFLLNIFCDILIFTFSCIILRKFKSSH